MPFVMDRASYARTYGPTVGDRLRLADTDLIVEVEDDRTIYGEEVIRRRQSHSRWNGPKSARAR